MDTVEQRRSVLKAEVSAIIDGLELHESSSLFDVAQAIYAQDGCLSLPWHIDDIRQAWANKYDVLPEDCPLDDAQCMDILRRIELKFDATIGINWDIIEYYIEEAGHCP